MARKNHEEAINEVADLFERRKTRQSKRTEQAAIPVKQKTVTVMSVDRLTHRRSQRDGMPHRLDSKKSRLSAMAESP